MPSGEDGEEAAATMVLSVDKTVRWFFGLLLGLLLAGVPDILGQQPGGRGPGGQLVSGDIRISALFDSENDRAIQAAFEHACNMVNLDRSTLITSRLLCSSNQIPQADSFKASKISRKKCLKSDHIVGVQSDKFGLLLTLDQGRIIVSYNALPPNLVGVTIQTCP